MTTKLPRIDQRGVPMATDSTKNFEQRTINESTERPDYVSPFKLPSDDEVFVYREVERKKRDELKQMSQDLKIWDKKTGTSRKPLRLFKNTEIVPKENIKTSARAGYNPKDKALIVEAQQIINERRKNRDTSGKDQKEGIVELLEQKKEMFLVERTVGIIEQERETLIQKATEKEDALKRSEEMLSKDMKEFEAFKQNTKQETDQVIQRYNQEQELRKKTEMDFKIKNNELTSLKAEKTKNEELYEKYNDARKFLLSLTPTEVLEENERELKAKIEELKAQVLRASKDEQNSVFSESHGKGFNKDKKGVIKKPVSSDPEKELAESIEEFKLSQKMYFTDPEQLIEIYTRLEEGNLGLIQMMQDTEQNLENLKNSLKQKKVEFDKKIFGLRENKMQLEKSKHEKESKIKTLENRSKEPQLVKKYDSLIPLKTKILEIARKFKDDTKGNVDMETLEPLPLLAIVELNLEDLLEKINQEKPAAVLEKKRDCEDRRKAENRKVQLERENDLAEERRAKANERAKEKPKKRTGRLDMMKSTPLEKKEAVTQVVQTNEEEEDMKYFKPYLTKF